MISISLTFCTSLSLSIKWFLYNVHLTLAPYLFSCLTYQTARKGWLEKTVKGEKKRYGARVRWTLYKNHLIDNESEVQKVSDIDITGEGMKLVE